MLHPRARREFPEDVKKRVEKIRENPKKRMDTVLPNKEKEEAKKNNNIGKLEARIYTEEAICEQEINSLAERSRFIFPHLPDINLTIQNRSNAYSVGLRPRKRICTRLR